MDRTIAARRLLQSGDERALRYAALETRMAIEELFYVLLPYYADELPSDILKRWQPRQIIDALLVQPDVEQYQQITIGGQNRTETIFAGQQVPVTRQLLKQYYQKLGSYLHAPVDGKERNSERMRRFLEAALTRIEQHCRETTVLHNGGMFLQHKCVCGRTIKRNVFAAGVRSFARCPDEACQAVWDVKIVKGGATWSLRLIEFQCLTCRVKTPLGTHLLQQGRTFGCIGCGSRYIIRVGPIAELVQSPGATMDEDGGAV